MIEIAQFPRGFSHQIIFNANKTAFERLFWFSQAPTILSHTVPRPLALLGQISTRIYCKTNIRNGKYKKVLAFLVLIFVSSFDAIKRNKSLAILLKNDLNVISLFITKIKVI